MKYQLTFTVAATREMRRLDPVVQRRINGKLARLTDGLSGDVKRLHNLAERYRLRVGDWRVLFDIEGDSTIVVRHVSHGSEAYE